MMNHYCRRCHAAVVSTALTCPLCGLSRPVYDNLSEIEKHYLSSPPSIPKRFQSMVGNVDYKKPLILQYGRLYANYISNSADSMLHRCALIGILMGVALNMISLAFQIPLFMRMGLSLYVIAGIYLVYDAFSFLKASYAAGMLSKVQAQGGTSPYSVHFKVENVLSGTLKNLQTLLYTFYDKPWEVLAQQQDITLAGDAFVQACKAITGKINKFAGISLETLSLLWRNNVYGITSLSEITTEEKIENLNLKIREAEAFILRYCWLKQLSFTHEFLESHLNGNSGRSTDDDRKYVIDGMQLSTMGPLSEPYYGNFETLPYELPFIMRYYWHQQLMPGQLPAEEIINQYPETSEIFESINQVRNLLVKLEEQKLIDSATASVSNYSGTEHEITSEASQIKRFQLYSQYLDIPKFQPSDADLLNRVDQLNAQIRI